MRGRRRVRGHGGAALILTLTLMLLPWRVSPSVIHSAPVYSLLALITTHGWRQGARFLLLPAHPPACDEEQPRRRRCRPRYHHRSLTASAPASVCLSLLCLHPRRQLPSAHVPPFSSAHLSHTPIARPSPGSTSSRSAHAKLQAHLVAHLPCRHHRRSSPSSPHPESLSARSSERACS